MTGNKKPPVLPEPARRERKREKRDWRHNAQTEGRRAGARGRRTRLRAGHHVAARVANGHRKLLHRRGPGELGARNVGHERVAENGRVELEQRLGHAVAHGQLLRHAVGDGHTLGEPDRHTDLLEHGHADEQLYEHRHSDVHRNGVILGHLQHHRHVFCDGDTDGVRDTLPIVNRQRDLDSV
jgi:hypothetical protein